MINITQIDILTKFTSLFLSSALTVGLTATSTIAEEMHTPNIAFSGLDNDGYAQLTSEGETWSHTCGALEDAYNIAFADLSHAFKASDMSRMEALQHDPVVKIRQENKQQIVRATKIASCPAMTLTQF